MDKYRVGIVGATGMVGQRFISLLKDHPWFQVTCVAASARSAGKTYREAVGNRWAFEWEIPSDVADMVVLDTDIFTCDPMEIRNILPVMTIVGGRIAWEK